MNAGTARTADLERLRANSEERVAGLVADVKRLKDELEELRAASKSALCALCEGQAFDGRVCIGDIWLCGPHGKVVALNRLQLTDADVEYGRRRG